MPRNPCSSPCAAAAAALTVVAAALAGCTPGLLHGEAAPPPDVDRPALQAAALTGHIDLLQKLIEGQPAQQAQILAGAQRDYELAPTASHTLRYALVLAAPDHAGRDPARAQQLLHTLLAAPETLLPAERALALIQLRTVERELTLAADNQRLQALADSRERERALASSRRLQAEQDENARLHKELDEARAKLDAIINIERSLNKPDTHTEASPQ